MDNDKIFITGMSGKGPNSNNLQEFKEQLYSKEDMVTTNTTRYPRNPFISERFGNIPNISNFDHTFFNIPEKEVECMDPGNRMMFEVTFEALLDAGINPFELKNTKTGFYLANTFAEGQITFFNETASEYFPLLGSYRALTNQRFAHFLGLEGHNYLADSACSSSVYCVDHALQDLKNGKIECAIIFSTNFILTSYISEEFALLGVLSSDGICRCFDESANGYVRSEGIYCLILQKGSLAKRQYAEIVNCKTNCDGFKEKGLAYPSSEAQQELLNSFYQEIGLDLNNIGYFEAHGTGTRAGDSEEMKTIEEAICSKLKDQLLIGSIKSKIGHAEASSGLASFVKLCLILQTDLIPPNLHFNKPHANMSGMLNEKIKLVTDITRLPMGKPYVALNNFGFGGTNAHALLKKMPTDNAISLISGPKLLCISGRTLEAIETILDDIKSRPFDPDFLSLLNASFNHYIPQHHYRAYAIIDAEKMQTIDIMRNMEFVKPLHCFFDADFNDSVGFIREMMEFKCFQDHLMKFCQVLNVSIKDIDNIHESLRILVLQTGVVELLNTLSIKVDHFSGNGIGALTSAYADGVITLENAILGTQNACEIISNENSSNSQPNNTWPDDFQVCNHSEHLSKCTLNEYLSTTPSNQTGINLVVIGGKYTYDKGIIHLGKANKGNTLLECIGKLYLLGYKTNLTTLYRVKWPVKSNTPMINHLIKWKHDQPRTFILRKTIQKDTTYSKISLNSFKWANIAGHNIDGRILFPASGYLHLVWQIFSPHANRPISIENIRFLRACTIPVNGSAEICLQICHKTGNFQFTDNEILVVTGRITYVDDFDQEWLHLPPLPDSNPENIMRAKDIYKELQLRGYRYQNEFKQMQTCDVQMAVGSIKWNDWITFIDNMFHFKLLSMDTRSINVPTNISRVLINPTKHWDLILQNKNSLDCILPIYNYHDLNIFRSGFVEVRGYGGASISKRKNPQPVLETHVFIPYVGRLDIEVAIRVMFQVAIENSSTTKAKIMEILIDQPIHKKPLTTIVTKVFNETPIIQLQYSKIENASEFETIRTTDCFLIIGHKLSQNLELFEKLKAHLKTDGFLISREPISGFKGIEQFDTLCEYKCDKETFVLLRSKEANTSKVALNITSNGFQWLQPLKEAQQRKEHLLLYSEKDSKNGLMGMVKCLIKEYGQDKVQCVCVDDLAAPNFNETNPFYKAQLDKNLCYNIYKNGRWGSYRHLLIAESLECLPLHSFVNNTIKGDVSSLCWIQGDLSVKDNLEDIKNDEVDVDIHVASLNFKDVVIATGKVSVDLFCTDRKKLDSVLGFEFAGKTIKGERVMGLWNSKALANYIRVSKQFICNIPNDWTMLEASTVPLVYSTLIYGLIMRANLRKGESILIHSATGGIGLSAINIALYYNCNIFLTVGTEKKREYIINKYPMVDPNHIGNSRNTSFYEMILKQTNGEGVDVILNSLADEKLQASVQCLKSNGRFVEIGKYDLNNDTALSMELATRNAEYHGVMLDNVMSNPSIFKNIINCLIKGIEEGYVKPLPYTDFPHDELENAFRYMMTGKHIGKVIIKIRDEHRNELEPSICKIKSIRKAYFSPKGSYLILGGLGGFGLELVDWMVIRGARNIVIASRSGITSGYQQLRKTLWESYGCKVKLTRLDVTTRDGCKAVLEEAKELGEILGVFNLAAVLRDAILENQTEETFLESCKPKSQMTHHLDELTRTMAPSLEHFVIFSSASCGRGTAGQTNYGYSNSITERICEKRHSEGLPGIAIQWGVIGDVGLVADNKADNVEVVIEGMAPQRIADCLEVMDVLMFNANPVVGSIVIFEKTNETNDKDLVTVVLELLQIKNVKTVSPSSTFPELGMDSMMAIEIKQTLERMYDIFLSNQELRSMNISKLMELVN